MKIAVVTDSLLQFGGTERVLQALLKIYPDAHVYTSFVDQSIITKFFPTLTKKQLFLMPIQVFSRFLRKHTSILQLLSPILWRCFNFENYDIVISSSSSMMCNLIRVRKPFHIQYIHNIPKNLFGLASEKKLQKIFPYTKLLVYYYTKTIKSSLHILTNSKYSRGILAGLFKINAKVIYPPVRIPKLLPRRSKRRYFMCISRLDRGKNIELAITACNRLKLPLKIVGESIDQKYKQYLKSIAGSTIEFLDRKSDREIDELYKSAIAFIFTTKNEDFGIAPVEAMARGVPVIAYYGGGLKETVIHGRTGLFFYEHNSQSLINTLKKFSPENFDAQYIYNYSKKFRGGRFTKQIKDYINSILAKK